MSSLSVMSQSVSLLSTIPLFTVLAMMSLYIALLSNASPDPARAVMVTDYNFVGGD